MHTLNIVLCSINVVICLINLASQEGKRMAYFIATMGWLVALANVAF